MFTCRLEVRGAAGDGQALGNGVVWVERQWRVLPHLMFWLLDMLTPHKSHPSKAGTRSPLMRLHVTPRSHSRVTRECHSEMWAGCAQQVRLTVVEQGVLWWVTRCSAQGQSDQCQALSRDWQGGPASSHPLTCLAALRLRQKLLRRPPWSRP